MNYTLSEAKEVLESQIKLLQEQNFILQKEGENLKTLNANH
jgi:hypothetical protein